MIRLEEDIIKIQKKFNLLDEKIKKDYIVENFNKLFDLALEKNIALKSGFPTLKLIFTETPKNNEKLSLINLRQILYEQLEKISKDDFEKEELDKEIKKSETMIKLAKPIIEIEKIALNSIEIRDNMWDADYQMPKMLDVKVED